MKHILQSKCLISSLTLQSFFLPLLLLAGHIHAMDSKSAITDPFCLPQETALHSAAKNKNIEVVKGLLAQKASVNARNNKGKTPLHELVSSLSSNPEEFINLVEILLASGASINSTNLRKETILYTACQNDDLGGSIIEKLVELGASPYHLTTRNYTILHVLLRKSEFWRPVPSLFFKFLKDTALINTPNITGSTPLH